MITIYAMRMLIRNDLSEMEPLRLAIQQFSDQNRLNADIIFALDLCMEELITNIIKYAYSDKNNHEIQVDLFLEGEMVVLEVRDDGNEFDPTKRPEPNLDLPLEERGIGGLGIHLIRHYVNVMEYKREGNQNITTLKKAFKKE